MACNTGCAPIPGQLIRRLAGFSGSAVELHELADGSRVVLKLAKNAPDARTRLQAQMTKHHEMESLATATGAFKVAAIRSASPDNSWYIRDYVDGWTLEEVLFLGRNGTGWSAAWAERLVSLLRALRAQKPVQDATPDAWVSALNHHLDAGADAAPWTDGIEIVKRCKAIRARPLPWAPPGRCHGDLAFDNILLDQREGRFWLIDPNPNRYETPLWDLAKMLQSTYCRWVTIKDPKLHAEDAAPSLTGALVAASGYEPQTVALFTALVLMRILPYAEKLATKRILARYATILLDQYLGEAEPFTPLPRVEEVL